MEHIGRVIDPVSGHIRQLTQYIPEPIEKLGIAMLDNEHCYDMLIRKVDFVSEPECVALGVSRGLSWGIVALSSVVKIPQILTLLHTQSSGGLSLVSYVLETVSYIINAGYNYRSGFPFSTFGESALISIQNIVVTYLIMYYSSLRQFAFAIVPVFVSMAYAILSTQYINPWQMQSLQMAAIPVSMASKIPQIYTNWRNKSTGQLSTIAVASYLFGSYSRLLTTLTEVDDPVLLLSFTGGAVLNTILAVQMVLYRHAPNKVSPAPGKAE
jgi:mannose-P-dolichol utilization defect protein 1